MVDIESDISTCVACVSAIRIVHLRYAKSYAYKEQKATELYKEKFTKVFFGRGSKRIDLLEN